MAKPTNERNANWWKDFLLARSPPDNQSAIPPQTGGMTPWLPPYQQPGAAMDFYRPMPNVAMTLPAFEQPGGSLPMDRYMQPQAQPQQAPATVAPRPQYVAQPQQQPAQSGGQGWGGPEPAPGTIPPEYDPNLDPRYLPEQWKGAFTNYLYPRNGR